MVTDPGAGGGGGGGGVGWRRRAFSAKRGGDRRYGRKEGRALRSASSLQGPRCGRALRSSAEFGSGPSVPAAPARACCWHPDNDRPRLAPALRRVTSAPGRAVPLTAGPHLHAAGLGSCLSASVRN